MNRRLWPAVLAILTLLIFGSYIAYTQFLASQIRLEARLQAKMYSLVQKALQQPDSMFGSVFDMQSELMAVNVPVVIFNAAGHVSAAAHIPDHPELAVDSILRTSQGQDVARRYAAKLNGRGGNNKIQMPGVGDIYFGSPALLDELRWVPYLQIAGAVLLIVMLLSILHSDQRAERERMYAAMARELAHQMGTPLSSLGGWVEVLQLPESARTHFTTTERIGDVMQADVERLERVSRRFELIGKPQTLELVAMSDVVMELEKYFKPRLPHLGRGIHLRTVVQPNMAPIRANRVLLVWAVENIVKNAIDALAGKGGRIVIAAHESGKGHVHMHVSDNGPGIEPRVRDRIFEAGVSTKSSGWGVGLSLTRRIVEELHHGKVVARHRRRHGTVFDIILPTAESAQNGHARK
jgi:signal transduction histidine kinase